MSDITNYLKMIVDVCRQQNRNMKYCSTEDFVLQHGKEWKSAPLPGGIEQGELGQCFQNSIQLSVSSGYKLRYVEGYALFHIPIFHAWCVDDKGVVIDTTWHNPEKSSYFGVAFDPMWAMQQMVKRRKYGILDDMERKFPILRGTIKPKFK